MVAQGFKRRRKRSSCIMGTEFQFHRMKASRKRIHGSVDVLKVSALEMENIMLLVLATAKELSYVYICMNTHTHTYVYISDAFRNTW